MKKSNYAIVVTDSGYIPGSNGMINALQYYNNKIDFYYLYCANRKMIDFVQSIKDCEELKTNVIPVDIETLKGKENYPINKLKDTTQWFTKMYRYLFAVNDLQEYDAVAIFDADMQIVNNIESFFNIADKTGRILIPNNDYSNAEYDNYDINAGYRGASSPPLHNMPLIFKPSIHVELFRKAVDISINEPAGDMVSINKALIYSGEIDNIIMLPNLLWVHSHQYNVKLFKKMIADKLYISIHRGGDRLYSFHRKWWRAEICEKYYNGIKGDHLQQIGRNNAKVFHDMTRFFNLELYHKIPWDDKWGYFSG